MKNFIKRILKEYVTNDIISLRNYLNMSEEAKKRYLPYEYDWFLEDFLYDMRDGEEIDLESYPEDLQKVYYDKMSGDYEDYDIIEWMEENYKELYDKFADYLYELIMDDRLNIPAEDYPAWAFLGNAKIVKNQWLIHFTNDAEGIARDGFIRGVSDKTKLGLTTRLSDFEKQFGGYNFAYDLGDYVKYSRGMYSGYKYGKEAVLFKASGIRMYHSSDREPQVIFYGNTAKNIIPIKKTNKGEYGEYGVYDMRDGKLLYESNNLNKVVDWVVKNYDQYRSRLYIR